MQELLHGGTAIPDGNGGTITTGKESWDNFYIRFLEATTAGGKRSDLSTEDLDRMIAGPTQNEKLYSTYGAVDLIGHLQEIARNWKTTDNQAGIVDNSSSGTSNIKDNIGNMTNDERLEKAKELRKEIIEALRGKNLNKFSTEEINKYIRKITEYKLYSNTQLDEMMTQYYADLNTALRNRGEKEDTTIYEGQVGTDGTVRGDNDKTSTGQLGDPNMSATHTPDEIISEAQGFINKGNSGQSTVNGTNLKEGSNTLYNTLLTIGIVTAVLVGVYLGAKFIMASAEDKAKVKESLIPYFAGCIVIFGAFIIWRLAINLLSTIDKTAKREYNIEYRIAKSAQNSEDFNIFS